MAPPSYFIHAHSTASISPINGLRRLWHHRQLTLQLTRRELQSRYKGSVLGWGWSLLTPCLMLGVYSFVFGVVFKARWGAALPQGEGKFAMVLFVGVLLHGLLSEVLNRAPLAIISQPNYVKKVVFPVEVLTLVHLSAALVHSCLAISVLIAAMAIQQQLHWGVLWLPLLMLPFAVFILGLAWFLAALGVFVRDTALVMPMLTMVMMFMAPVFYPLSAVPEAYRDWMWLNPLTFVIEQMRAVLFAGVLPDFAGLALYSLLAVVVAWAGFAWFQKTRKGFADVL